jgi:large subunit ribosomal protein L35
MPKNKSHRGLLKRIKLTKSGKVRFKAPNGRHLKSNKTGVAVQSYRKSRYARTGDLRYLKKLLSRGLRSEEKSIADEKARAATAAKAS